MVEAVSLVRVTYQELSYALLDLWNSLTLCCQAFQLRHSCYLGLQSGNGYFPAQWEVVLTGLLEVKLPFPASSLAVLWAENEELATSIPAAPSFSRKWVPTATAHFTGLPEVPTTIIKTISSILVHE